MKYIKFNKELYGVDGMIGLVRGDDWLLTGRVVDNVQGVDLEVDLTGDSITGFFPSASGCGIMLPVTATITNPTVGQIQLSVPKGQSPQVLLSDVGLAPYVTLQSAVLQTIYPYDAPVKVTDRGQQ